METSLDELIKGNSDLLDRILEFNLNAGLVFLLGNTDSENRNPGQVTFYDPIASLGYKPNDFNLGANEDIFSTLIKDVVDYVKRVNLEILFPVVYNREIVPYLTKRMVSFQKTMEKQGLPKYLVIVGQGKKYLVFD